jgi:hypothetical protein
VNTEELERSLRAEFDEHLSKVLAEARQEVEALQKNVNAELDKQRGQMEEAFRAINARLEVPADFGSAFSETVVEHLRLARDDGARVTAAALGEAEKLSAPVEADHSGYGKLRDAIAEIKSKPTQAAILRSLVDSAANFAPRGAFFIVKNDHLVGWKVFGCDADEGDVRAIHFALSSETLLSNAVNSLSLHTDNGANLNGNAQFLEPLGFGRPEHMIAVPLSARGRGVAVLYADCGEQSDRINTEALETLVSVAGLTVELLAGGASSQPETSQPIEPQHSVSEPQAEQPEIVAEPVQKQSVVSPEPEQNVAPIAPEQSVASPEPQEAEYVGDVSVSEEPVAYGEIEPPVETTTSEFAFSQNNFSDAPVAEAVVEEVTVQEAPAAEEPRRRIAERGVDLPIEVSESERRPHSDARRFARLLVSEIKLYNEQRVAQGRESGEIYDVLREAIDRSREMYDKRVQPDVAAKFDYFHYELVNNLAEGVEEKLGAGYFAAK